MNEGWRQAKPVRPRDDSPLTRKTTAAPLLLVGAAVILLLMGLWEAFK